jgi:hypothetical protein
MVGWESMTALTSSATANFTGSVGAGSGQFPTPTQLLTTGHVVLRKSSTADTSGRFWQLVADSSTFYLFISTGDTGGTYYPGMFGDVFSLKGASDAYRCLIVGRAAENTTGPGSQGSATLPFGNDQFDAAVIANVSTITSATAPNCGHFLARTYGGGGAAITAAKHFDIIKASYAALSGNSWMNIVMCGTMQTPNGPDNSLYLTPVQIVEPVGQIIRGRMRGMYQVCHPIASFSDGEVFAGAGDYAGKTFMIVKQGVNGGIWLIETSNTVESNV